MKSFNIRDSLGKLEIIPDDIQVISDGEQGYIILLTSNLTDDGKDKIAKLGFVAVNEELWYKPGDVSDEITRDQLFSILERKREKNLYNKAEIVKTISIIWERIIDNFKCISELLGKRFRPTFRHVVIACKFKDFLCTNEDEFKVFISYLRQFAFESFKEIQKKEFGKTLMKNLDGHEFNNNLRLRHYFDHDLGMDPDPEKKQEEIRSLYSTLLGKPIARKPEDFFIMQKRLMESCEAWFEEIIKYCENNFNKGVFND